MRGIFTYELSVAIKDRPRIFRRVVTSLFVIAMACSVIGIWQVKAGESTAPYAGGANDGATGSQAFLISLVPHSAKPQPGVKYTSFFERP